MTLANSRVLAGASPEAKRAGTRLVVRRWLALLVPAGLLLAWFLATDVLRIFSPNQLPSPGQTLRTALDMIASGDLFRHIGASVGHVLLGFSIGAAIALIAGALVGLSRSVEAVVDPTLQALRNIPSLAWVPFLLLWLGIDEAPKITLIAIGAFFPVYLNLVSGIRQADRKLVEVGYVFGFRSFELVRRIVLPSASPYLLAGLRIGFGQAWLFLVAAELIASTRGLGFMLIDGQNSARPDIMLVSILTLALLGKLSNSALRAVEWWALHWADVFQGR
jgi:sulfonate transport system permease protein|uniref:ABC transporter permease n=1 Tax=Candidatus Roseilinea sp. NK_OTU-006 TaxID=2704250 RepID=UPI00145E0240|nr:ABC transporter permease [Candidatus Roseilinea sp. NK_OTU-006]